VNSLGHRHPAVIAAIKAQLDRLVFINSLDYYTVPQIEYAEMLFPITPGSFDKRVFYCNSGSEAIDTSIKMAKWHTRRAYGIGFVNGFHGRTMGAVSFTTTGLTARRGFAPLYPIAQFVPYPYCYRCMFNREYPGCDLHCLRWLEDVTLKKITPPDEVAFFLVEPVQGAGGYIVPPPEFLPRLAAIARQHGIVLIVDEVQTGFGRTGKMWASDHSGVAPDIMAISKAFAAGLPAGAAVARAEVMDWDEGAHEGTLNGGPVVLEAAKAVLRVIAEENLVEKSRVLGEYLKRQLLAFKERYPVIGDVRGMGLMVGIELVEDAKKTPAKDKRNRLVDEAFRRGLLLLAASESSIRFAPPLVITQAQIDQGLDIFESCLKEL
jgi:4-aminobutyrate aminotransferase